MHLEEFATGGSFAHRLDPRIKIVTTLLFSLVLALTGTWTVMGAGLAAAALLVMTCRLDLKLLLARLFLVNFFIFFLWLFLPFTHPGPQWFLLGPLPVSREGVLLALSITLKSNAIVLATIGLLTTSPVFALVHALSHLRIPDKLLNLFFFTFRYFQVLHQEYLRLRGAMKVRCFRLKTNLHTYRSLAYLLAMLIIRGFDRSERVHQAMLCRGFKGRFWLLSHFHFHRLDYVFIGLAFPFISILAVLSWIQTIP